MVVDTLAIQAVGISEDIFLPDSPDYFVHSIRYTVSKTHYLRDSYVSPWPENFQISPKILFSL